MAALLKFVCVRGSTIRAQDERGGRQLPIVEATFRGELGLGDPEASALAVLVRNVYGDGQATADDGGVRADVRVGVLPAVRIALYTALRLGRASRWGAEALGSSTC